MYLPANLKIFIKNFLKRNNLKENLENITDGLLVAVFHENRKEIEEGLKWFREQRILRPSKVFLDNIGIDDKILPDSLMYFIGILGISDIQQAYRNLICNYILFLHTMKESYIEDEYNFLLDALYLYLKSNHTKVYTRVQYRYFGADEYMNYIKNS